MYARKTQSEQSKVHRIIYNLLCKLARQLFIAYFLRSVLFVCGLATLIAIETSYYKLYIYTVVYFRVISYVLLGIFAESIYIHKFHKKFNPFCVSPHGVRGPLFA